MITGKKVTEFHREQDKLLREESEKYNTYMKVLSTREKRKLSNCESKKGDENMVLVHLPIPSVMFGV